MTNTHASPNEPAYEQPLSRGLYTRVARVVSYLFIGSALIVVTVAGDPTRQPLLYVVLAMGALLIPVGQDLLPMALLGRWRAAVEAGAVLGFLTLLIILTGGYNSPFVLGYILLLAGTLLFGYEVNGARLWVNLGPVSVQPGEFLKIVLVVFIAGYLAETRTLLTSARMRIGFLSIPPLPYFLPMLALFGVVMLIIARLNDLGTALLFFGIFLTMLFVATGRRSYVLIGLLLFVGGAFVAYQLFGHVQLRVNVWLDPFADPLGAGFQPVRAIYALGPFASLSILARRLDDVLLGQGRTAGLSAAKWVAVVISNRRIASVTSTSPSQTCCGASGSLGAGSAPNRIGSSPAR